jgi:hypothetical protein
MVPRLASDQSFSQTFAEVREDQASDQTATIENPARSTAIPHLARQEKDRLESRATCSFRVVLRDLYN